MEHKYYEINEEAARQAKENWSFSEYVKGSKTAEYRAQVDEAYKEVDKLPDSLKEKGAAMAAGDTDLFKVVENAEIMRLQIFFDEKPDADIRAILKSNGFKWAPSNGAWQRQLTVNARYALERVKEEINK